MKLKLYEFLDSIVPRRLAQFIFSVSFYTGKFLVSSPIQNIKVIGIFFIHLPAFITSI